MTISCKILGRLFKNLRVVAGLEFTTLPINSGLANTILSINSILLHNISAKYYIYIYKIIKFESIKAIYIKFKYK